MATVITISGTSSSRRSEEERDHRGCKDVRNKKTGCVTKLCPKVGKNGRKVMRFKSGTTQCPVKRA